MLPRIFFALALLFALAACAAQPAPAARQEQIVDGLTIGFEAVDSPRLNRPVELIVTLADAQGRPVDGATVYFDLTMPAMPMGTNAPIAEPLGQGRYRAGNVVMDMVGDWEVAVVASVAGKEHRAVFTRVVTE